MVWLLGNHGHMVYVAQVESEGKLKGTDHKNIQVTEVVLIEQRRQSPKCSLEIGVQLNSCN